MAIKDKAANNSSSFRWLKPVALLLLVGVTVVATVYIMFLQPANLAIPGKALPEAPKVVAPALPVPEEAPPAAAALPAATPPPPEPAEEPLATTLAGDQEALIAPPPVAAAAKPQTTSPPPGPTRHEPLPAASKPRVAIIIDDLGQQKKIPEQLLALGLNFSFAFLPHTPYAQELARQAHAAGHDILLHLPLEAEDSHWNTGAGTLLLKMSPESLRQTLRADLATVPLAMGINNHLGSRFTADRGAMTTLLQSVREGNLFFVDSLTSAKSVGYPLAQELGIKSGRRDIFLDNEADPDKIGQQLQALIALARKNGSAIAIGHPHPATLTALTRMAEQLRTQTTVVGVQALVR